MLEKLNDHQKKIMLETRDEWINRFFSLEFDEKKARVFLNWIYNKFLKLPDPVIIILDSPFSCQIGANLLKVFFKYENKRGAQVRDQVGAQVGAQVWDQVRAQVWAQVWAQVGAQVWERNLLECYYESYYLSSYDFDWVALYDFYSRIGVVKKGLFTKYREFVKSNIFSSILLKGIAILSKPPGFIKRNENKRMHSINSPAIHFNDGYELNFVEGIYFNPQDFNKFFVDKNASGSDVLSIRNQEQRAAVIKHYGYKRLARSLKLKEISRYQTKEGYINKLYSSELLPIRLLKVIDATTRKPYYLGVPKEQKNCLSAIAWTFNLSKKEYEKRIES